MKMPIGSSGSIEVLNGSKLRGTGGGTGPEWRRICIRKDVSMHDVRDTPKIHEVDRPSD